MGILSQVAKRIKAYHGSPHDFDKFSTENIGTGEGAQAYGHGLYFAEREGTAKSYKSSTNYADKKRQFQNELPDDAYIEDVVEMKDEGAFSPEMTELISALEDDGFLGFDYPSQAISAAFSKNLRDYDPSDRLKKAVNNGHMYEVDINASTDELLDFDAPLSEQSDYVKSKLPQEVFDYFKKTNDPRGINLVHDNPLVPDRAMIREPEYAAQAAAKLNDLGIKGIKYTDAQTRFSGGDKTQNYVIFDDKTIEIARKYGVSVPVAGAILAGTMTPEDAQASVPQVKDGLLKDTGDVLLENMAGVNRGVVDALNFFTVDQINAISQLMGSDKRVPTLYDMPLIEEGTSGNFMDKGALRQAVRQGSEFLSPI